MIAAIWIYQLLVASRFAALDSSINNASLIITNFSPDILRSNESNDRSSWWPQLHLKIPVSLFYRSKTTIQWNQCFSAVTWGWCFNHPNGEGESCEKERDPKVLFFCCCKEWNEYLNRLHFACELHKEENLNSGRVDARSRRISNIQRALKNLLFVLNRCIVT